jgi:molybdate transport system substrate-binding protein
VQRVVAFGPDGIRWFTGLIVVPGIEIVGRFPGPVQNVITLSAAVFKSSANRELARRFLDTFRSDRPIAAYRRNGLDAIGSQT